MKSLFCWLLLGVICLLSSTEGRAVVPVNDLCSGAIVIPGAGPFPYLSQVVTNLSEATTNGDPALSCSTNKSSSIWFKFVPTASGVYTFTTGADTATTLGDSLMGLYSASSCASPFTERFCADDVPGDLRAAFTTNLTANTTYFLVVWSFGPNAPDDDEDSLQLRVSKPVTPTNDICSAAQVIPSLGPFPYFTPPMDITFASTNSDPPMSDCQFADSFSRSVWYKFTPSNTITYTFSTCMDTATTVRDTILAVYQSSSGCAGPLVPVDCNDEACDSSRSMVSATLTKGQNYYVVVWEYGINAPVPGQTQVQLEVTVPPPVFTSVTYLGGGSYRVALTGFAGQAYTIEASTNLVDWVPIGNSTNVNGGNYQLTLTNVVSPSYRFFRAKGQ